eukprot:m.235061 g.235061  ORF g.235061 m.235061 type:complete len:80 (+) comp15258_c5_seq2:4645-4884(+)
MTLAKHLSALRPTYPKSRGNAALAISPVTVTHTLLSTIELCAVHLCMCVMCCFKNGNEGGQASKECIDGTSKGSGITNN